jgi:hypothetical protein
MAINLSWLTPALGESLLPHWRAKTRSGDSSDSTRAGFHFRAEKGSSPAIAADYCFWKAFWETLPKPMWLGWLGESMPALEQTWRCYLRRFAVDHWNRFAKQRLHWTLPNFSTTKLAERWSDLMPLLNWQLWLARDIVKHPPLPWQKQQTDLTPGRVAQGLQHF